jgi:hypothetical protein
MMAPTNKPLVIGTSSGQPVTQPCAYVALVPCSGCLRADAPHRRQGWERPHAPAPRHARLRCVTRNRIGQVAAEYTLERRHVPGSYGGPYRLSNERFSNITLTTWSKLCAPSC